MIDYDDISLMHEINNGNRGAFDVLVRRHSQYFFAIIYRFVNNRDLAEDLLQTAFLKLWERPFKFNPDAGAGFKTWFARVTVNLCLDDRRARRPCACLDDMEIADTRPDAPELIDRGRRIAALNAGICKLPSDMRTAITLGWIQDMKYAEVGKIMNKNENTVKVIISRAKEKLKQYMQENGYDGI